MGTQAGQWDGRGGSGLGLGRGPRVGIGPGERCSWRRRRPVTRRRGRAGGHQPPLLTAGENTAITTNAWRAHVLEIPRCRQCCCFVLHKAISAAAFTTATSNKHGLVCLFLILFFISFVLGEKMVTPESSTQRSSQLLMIIVLCPGPVKKGGSGGVGSVPATLLPGLRTGSTLGQRAATAAEGGQGEPRTP